jgi:hypothetical protein
MKYLLIVFFTLLSHITFSQKGNTIKGQVFNNYLPVKDAEVINSAHTIVTKTDENGKFEIIANQGNRIMFYHKDFEIKKIVITNEHLESAIISIYLIKKNIELQEIEIKNHLKVNIDYKNIQNKVYFDDLQSSPKNTLVYDGLNHNTVDFAKILGLLFDIFKKEKTKKSEEVKITFKELITSAYSKEFLTQNLQIPYENIDLFIEYCDADSNSKTLVTKENPLDIINFMITKSIEFKKL